MYQSSFDTDPVTSKCRITAWVAYTGTFLLNIQNMKRALYEIRTYRALNIVSRCPFFLRFYWDSQWLYSSRSKKPRRGLLSLQIWQTWLRRKMYRYAGKHKCMNDKVSRILSLTGQTQSAYCQTTDASVGGSGLWQL